MRSRRNKSRREIEIEGGKKIVFVIDQSSITMKPFKAWNKKARTITLRELYHMVCVGQIPLL